MLRAKSGSSSEILPQDDGESNSAESSKISPSTEPLSLPSIFQPVLKNMNNIPGALPSYPLLKSTKRRAGPIARVRRIDRKTENSEVKKVTQESATTKCSLEKSSPVNSPLKKTPNLENDLNLPSSPSKVDKDKQERIKILDIQKIHSKGDPENADEKSSSPSERNDSESSRIICAQEQTPTSPLTSLISESSTLHNNEISPPSPSKLFKNRIKASPSLGNWRSHTSSELEDISKNIISSRTRNDSLSSSVSRENPPSTPKKSDAESRKKMRKSEGSKKLAEARKEFARKFENKKPDHKKLTMMDLIFYNPTTNLMKYEDKKPVTSENDVDDPTEPINDKESQNAEELSEESEEEAIGPKIKIGPDGEIILDEKSLVIENKKAKKAIEAIEKSKLIDGNIDRPYGVFKRTKRSKWSKSDTLKFYRALSSVGTDFAIMTELFPNRTRRELKLKFKKEERDNRVLVDQAVMNPCNFNFEDLKTEFKMMEIEENEIEQQQINNKEMNKKKENKKTQKFSKLTEGDAGTNSSENNSTKDKPEPSRRKRNLKPPKLRKPEKPPKKVKFDILSTLSDSEEVEDSESESEVPLVLSSTHTTRYGRKTKRREMYEPDLDDSILLQKRKRENPESEVSNAPGSLMVVPSETSDGNPVVKIFMVTDDNTENSDSSSANNKKQLIPIAMIRTDQNEVEEEIIENNYTIPANNDDMVVNKEE